MKLQESLYTYFKKISFDELDRLIEKKNKNDNYNYDYK